MSFVIGICEDNQSDYFNLKSIINLYSEECGIEFTVKYFHTGDLLFEQYAKGEVFDFLFLDIEMPGSDGIEISRKIRRFYDPEVRIIFISSYPSYMESAFEVRAYRFLHKPLSYEVFLKTMNALMNELTENQFTLTVVDSSVGKRLIKLRDLTYVSTNLAKEFNRTLCYHLVDEDITVFQPFTVAEEILTGHNFLSPHRGYLVNLRYVKTFHTDTLELTTGDIVPLSRRRAKEFKNNTTEYFLTMKYQL